MGILNIATKTKGVVEAAHRGDWGAAAGKTLRAVAETAHPIGGRLAGPAIEHGTEAAFNGVKKFVQDPEVQAKAREIGGKAVEIGGDVAKNVGEFAGQAGRRLSSFVQGHMGAKTHEHQGPVQPHNNL